MSDQSQLFEKPRLLLNDDSPTKHDDRHCNESHKNSSISGHNNSGSRSSSNFNLPNNTSLNNTSPSSAPNSALYHDDNLYMGPDSPGKCVLLIIALYLLYSFVVFTFTSRVDRHVMYNYGEIETLLQPIQHQLYHDLLRFPIDILIVDDNDTALNSGGNSSQLFTFYNDLQETLNIQAAMDYVYYKPHSNTTLSININEIRTITPKSLDQANIFRQFLDHPTDVLNDDPFTTCHNFIDLLDDVLLAIPHTSSPNILQYVFLSSSLFNEKSSPYQTCIIALSKHENFIVGKYNHAFIVYNDNMAPFFPHHKNHRPVMKSALLNTIWSQLQPYLLLPIPTYHQHLLSLLDHANSKLTSDLLVHRQHIMRINERFTTIFGITMKDYIQLRPQINTKYHIDYVLFHYNKPMSDFSDDYDLFGVVLNTIQSYLSPSVQLTTTIHHKTDLSILTKLKKTSQNLPLYENIFFKNTIFPPFFAKLRSLWNSATISSPLSTSSSFVSEINSISPIMIDTSSSTILPTLLNIVNLNLNHLSQNDTSQIYHTPPNSDTIYIAQWGSITFSKKASLNHFLTQLKLILGLGVLPQTHTTDRAIIPNLSATIPIARWQVHLYTQTISLAYTYNIYTTILSTFKLLEEAQHMPFPQHIANQLAKSIHLFTNITRHHDVHTSFHQLAQSNELSTAVFYHYELLPQLHFPLDQLVAVYAPFFAPTLVPIIASAWSILVLWLKHKIANKK